MAIKRNQTPKSEMEKIEQERDELITALEDIAGLADEADDAGLTREEIIEKVRAITERVEEEIEMDEPEGN